MRRGENRAPLYAVLGANSVSLIGDMMVAVAIPWFVLQTTGSVVYMGFTGAVVGFGALMASVAGGPLVDRFGLRRASLLSDVSAGIAVTAIPLLYWADALPFGLFPGLALLISTLNAPGDLARRAMVPTLARWAQMPLERANSADTAIPRLAQLAGPILGGVLVASLGAANVLMINAATFFVSAAAVALGVSPRIDGESGKREDSRHHQVFADCRMTRPPSRQYLRELGEGFRFVRSSGLIVSLIVIAIVANMLEKPLMSVVVPVYAEEFYGSAASFGAMLTAFGAGALAGTIGFGFLGGRLPRRATFVTCLLLAPLLMFGALAATPPLTVLLVAVAASGLLFGPMNSLLATAIQEITPPALLGRVFGAVTALAMVGVPAGATLVGLTVDEFGLVDALIGMGVIYLALGLSMTFNPALRTMDRPVPDKGEA